MKGKYDLICIGGGIGGSALAKAIAQQGARVLVLEQEKEFKDRVRGESLMWGVADAQALGILDLLRDTCGHVTPWWDITLGPMALGPRDLAATTPGRAPYLTFYHPAMQQALFESAEAAGADVRREASVRGVTPGPSPVVLVEQRGRTEEFSARLVVGADGRSSAIRKFAGFTTRHDPPALLLAGVLLEDIPLPRDDAQFWWMNPSLGQEVLLIPIGGGRVRSYLGYHKDSIARRFQGAADLPQFIEHSTRTGVPRDLYSKAKAAGPLATFDGADSWVEHPYSAGVALIGDAAAASDPSFGQGLSLTMRDVRVLRDNLLQNENWDVAGHAYAEAHDRYYDPIHRVERWSTELLFDRGADADLRRARALPLIAQDVTRLPDHIFSGPELPADEAVRRRFYGEEAAAAPR